MQKSVHMSVGEAKGVANNYDMIFVSETFTYAV